MNYFKTNSPLFNLVNLVERNPNPDGFQLANPAESGKVDQFALVELAGAIQQVILCHFITENNVTSALLKSIFWGPELETQRVETV